MGQVCSKKQIQPICSVLLRLEERSAMIARGRQTAATFEGWERRWQLLKGKREQGGAAVLWRGMRGGDCLGDQGRVVGIWRIAERNHEEEEMGVWRWLLASGEEVAAGGAAAVWGMAVVARVRGFGRRKHLRRGRCWSVAGGEDSGWG